MTDTERERKIQQAASGIEAAMYEWDQFGFFSARGRSDSYRLEMENLIRGRSAEKVGAMEDELGLL